MMLTRTLLVLGSSAGLSSLSAQEIATGVFLNGWSDNVLTWAHDPSKTEGGGSLGAENFDSVDFSTSALLRVDWTVNSQVSGRVSVRFNDVGGTPATDVGQAGAYLTESWVMVQVSESTSVTMGKFYNLFGWQGAEPTQLNRIGYGLTVDYYGANDPLGVTVAYTRGDFLAMFQASNGFFKPSDGTNTGSVNSNYPLLNDHQRNDLGLFADFTLTPGGESNFVNLEFAWDPSSSAAAGVSPAATPFPGSIFQAGLNGTYHPNEKLLLGGEVIYRNSQNGVVATNGSFDSKQDLAWMATATQTLDTAEKLCPMAATLMFSSDNQDVMGDKNTSLPVQSQVALALLTNPYDTTNFGLNLEYQYQWGEGTNSNTATSRIMLEGLVVIP